MDSSVKSQQETREQAVVRVSAIGIATNVALVAFKMFVGAVTGTFLPAWDLQNVEWLVSGGAISAAPHVWTQGLSRLSMWTCSAWPLLILMMKDSKKLPQFKALAAVAFPPAIFSIVEPIIFGLPIMLNPYLIIPFVVSHTLSAILTYAATAAWPFWNAYVEDELKKAEAAEADAA